MIILGIETSCDETSAAVIEATPSKQRVKLLSNVSPSSLELHAKTGGIIPEIAAREQIKYIIPVIKQSLNQAKISLADIDTIAVTYGPGLIGSLLVGVETAKTLALAYNKPIIPVNHLLGHVYANWIEDNLKSKPGIEFPAVALIVSGGHTDLLFMKSHKQIIWLGGTRDDAAGEAFDKIGRLLRLPYPGGPSIEKIAKKGTPKTYTFPKPLIYDKMFDFSFSGLKTAALRAVEKIKTPDEQTIADISLGVQDAIISVLKYKTLMAAKKYKAKSIVISGGVSANQTLRDALQNEINSLLPEVNFYAPDKNLCTDNAAMIASAAFFHYEAKPWEKITANPELYFE